MATGCPQQLTFWIPMSTSSCATCGWSNWQAREVAILFSGLLLGTFPATAPAMESASMQVSLNGSAVLEGTYLVGWLSEPWSALQSRETVRPLQPLGEFIIQPEPGDLRVAVLHGNLRIRFEGGGESAVSELRLIYRETPRPGWYVDPDWIEDTIFGWKSKVLVAASSIGAALALFSLVANWWPRARRCVRAFTFAALLIAGGALLTRPLLNLPGPVGFPQTLLLLQVTGAALAAVALALSVRHTDHAERKVVAD